MAGEDKHSKKHPASDHKKRNLKKKGTVAKSQDVPMAAGLLAAFGILVTMREYYIRHFKESMTYCIEQIQYISEPGGIDLLHLMLFALVKIVLLSAPILVAIMIIGVVANMGQTGLVFTGEQLKPNFKKLNPMTKLKQWFSIKSLQELAKSLAKIVAASILGYIVWSGDLEKIRDSVGLDALGLLLLGGGIIKKMIMYIIILYLVVAIIDFMFQKKNFATEHKMTDKEVKDEYKQMEGDPYMKAKRRQVAQQIAFQQSQEHVPESDVVVINPTELAIALKFDADLSPVPFVLSKGEKRHADDIRSAARKAGVPVVRNKPLARALYDMCEIGDLVPEDLYRPVAEVLAYVFALKEQAATGESPGAADQAEHAAHDLQQIVVPVVVPPASQQQLQPTGPTNAGAPAPAAPWYGVSHVAEPVPAAPWLQPAGGDGQAGFADLPVYKSADPSYLGGVTARHDAAWNPTPPDSSSLPPADPPPGWLR